MRTVDVFVPQNASLELKVYAIHFSDRLTRKFKFQVGQSIATIRIYKEREGPPVQEALQLWIDKVR